MPAYASPHITLDDWQSGLKTDIDVFEDQLRTWLFAQARIVSAHEHAGVAILALVTPYFEAIAAYLRGETSRGAETAFLLAGLEAVFPAIAPATRKEYANQVRHGVVHEAMFRRVLLHRSLNGWPPLGLVDGLLAVDPWWVLARAEQHFDGYVSRLRANDVELTGNFSALMAIRKSR